MRGSGRVLLVGLTLSLTLALAAPGVVGGAAAATAATPAGDSINGVDRPPAGLGPHGKAVWMTEWAACWRVRLGTLSSILHVPVRSGMTPQAAARRLSKRAMRDLYETQLELAAGADGCRNGILWRYYHPT